MEKLLKQYSKMVNHIIFRYFYTYEMQHDDLRQVGDIAIWKASLTFDESKGTKFSTYVYNAIRNAMTNYMYPYQSKIAPIFTSMDERLKESKDGDVINMHDILSDTINSYDKFSKISDIRYAIQELTEREKTSVLLNVICGYNDYEIGRAYGLDRSCISKARNRAYIKMRPKLKGYEFR